MIIPRDIRQKHSEQAAQVEFVGQRVASTMQTYCATKGFVYDGRPKTLESLAEKIESGRFSKWSDLDDLFACTVAVPLPADEEEVLTFLRSTFQQVDLKKRLSARKAPDVFRFDSTRFIGQLNRPAGMDASNSSFDVRFEIQIKTLFEMAWSKTTHALAYKSSRVDWRAIRLAAALKASVEQMDLLLSDFENAMKHLGAAPWHEVERKMQIQDCFLSLQARIPSEAWPKDISRFVENCYALLECLQRHEQWRKRDREIVIYDAALKELSGFIEKQTSESFPRSISLFQLVFGVLTSVYEFPPDGKACFPISPELESLFPNVKPITKRFEFV
jgi:ppGpp synthetase/RelA/SpoT-type nucleotidyltranferase